jgi:hypothetical protein
VIRAQSPRIRGRSGHDSQFAGLVDGGRSSHRGFPKPRQGGRDIGLSDRPKTGTGCTLAVR